MGGKQFYCIIKNEKIGPIYFEDLKDLELSCDTLIWFDGLKNWTEVKDIPELTTLIKLKAFPPPIPKKGEKTTKTEVYGELKIQLEKRPNQAFEFLKSAQSALRIFLIWSSIHLFALISSYSEINLFNKGKPRTNEFWPFVNIFEYYGVPDVWFGDKPKPYWYFNGIFYNYDWSEFLVFVGGALLILIISRLSILNSQNLKI